MARNQPRNYSRTRLSSFYSIGQRKQNYNHNPCFACCCYSQHNRQASHDEREQWSSAMALAPSGQGHTMIWLPFHYPRVSTMAKRRKGLSLAGIVKQYFADHRTGLRDWQSHHAVATQAAELELGPVRIWLNHGLATDADLSPSVS
jgi:hypothetical protein